ncbi:MAG: ABC transporter permease [Bacilli bacterium]|jgi:spermidine/putrescine transport system permease protein|nr:ABC transporter permease [Bacillota bacterium]NLI52630.1 ABC transporter permease [Erysipelotrichaceae bacterium]HOA11172.1 ABC transporter permease [Bacilli bacterium]TAH59164.1 MAG: ABC transporter permease [Bacillota bacterium]HOM32228.1 ABC transporter permease [Bacilli bacterium]
MIKKILAKVYVYLILFLLYLPILFLIIYSFTPAETTGVWEGFSFELYGRVFLNEKIMRALLNTLIIALSSATVATILGTLGAIGVFYMKKRPQRIMEGINEIPVVNAEIVVAISLAILFRVFANFLEARGVATNSPNFVTLLIGHVVLSISFVYLNVKPKLQQMDPNDYEAALDLGAKPMYAIRKVVLPAIVPGIISGFMLAFTLSLDDFIITNFLRNQSFDTLSTYVQGVIVRAAIPAEMRALTTYIVLVTLAVVLVSGIKRESRSSRKAMLRAQKREVL